MLIFDIIFQSGDFYNQDSKGIPEIIVNFIIAIISLIGGFLLNYWYENHKEKKQLKVLTSEFYINVQGLIKSLEEQKKDFDDFIKKIESKKNETLFLSIISNLSNIETSFNTYSKSEILRYYLITKKEDKKQIIKDINNLFEHIYFIGITISISRNTVDEISIGINKNIENWDKNILIIIHKLNEYINLYKNNQIKIPTDQYIIDALTIFDSHIKNPEKANIFIAIDSLINPLVNLRHKYIKDLRVFEIQEYLTECSIAHREINKLKELYGRMYSNFIDEIDSTKNDIIQITSRIDPF